MAPWCALLLAALFLPGLAQAAKLRVCVDAVPHPPLMYPDGSGTVGRVIAEAAREAGFVLEYYAAPLARCRAEAERDVVQAFPMTPYLPELLPYVAFPQRLGAVDPQRASVVARVALFRRVGSRATWNGRRIADSPSPVLVAAGTLAISDALRRIGARADQNARSLEVNFARMLAGRGDLAAGFSEEGERLLMLPAFAGRIEELPLPLFEQPYYFAVSKGFYAQHGPAVERMWNALGRLHQPAKTLKK